jgi:hypothetical protein
MGFGLYPLILIAAVTLIGAVACLVFAYLASHWLKRGNLIVADLFLLGPSVVALIGFRPELVDDRFRTYKQLFGDIEVGMSRAKVMTLVDQHYPSGGKRLRPTIVEDSDKKLSFWMNPKDSKEPNCEGIFLQMQDDRVMRKSYARD